MIEVERRLRPIERIVRVSQLPLIQRTEDARRAQLRQLEALKGDLLVVTIDGERQDDAMIAEVLPVVERLLRLRLQSLTTDLRMMGVSVG